MRLRGNYHFRFSYAGFRSNRPELRRTSPCYLQVMSHGEQTMTKYPKPRYSSHFP
jgi:hypothetical protein